MRPVGTNGGPVASARGRGGVADRRAVGCQPRRAGGRVGAGGPSWPSAARPRAVRSSRRRGLLCRRHHRALCRAPAPSPRSCHSPRAKRARSARRRPRRGGMLGAVRVEGAGTVRGRGSGVDHVTCLDLGDGRLAAQPLEVVAAAARAAIDHVPARRRRHVRTGRRRRATPITSHRAWRPSRRCATCPIPATAARPVPDARADPRRRDRRVADGPPRAVRRHTAFGHAFKLFTDGTSMLGRRRRSPACRVVSGGLVHHRAGRTRVRAVLHPVGLGRAVVVESEDGEMHEQRSFGAGCFVGEDGLASVVRATPTSSPATT